MAEVLPSQPSTEVEHGFIRLRLLGAFKLELDCREVDIPMSAQRLLAMLALRPHGLTRSRAAGVLWPDARETRAVGNLRSALWRLRSSGLMVVEQRHGTLHLHDGVAVDVETAMSLARRHMAGTATAADLEIDVAVLEYELLPDWEDDWLTGDRERFRQLRLHGLEALSENLVRQGRYAEALEAALATVEADPLRETAHRALIRVHVAEGNVGEAIRQLRRCERLLRDELGVLVSIRLTDLIRERPDLSQGGRFTSAR